MNKKIERWRGFVPDADLATYAKGAFGNPIGMGSRPALVNIDTTWMFVDPQYGFVLRGQGSGFDWNAVFGIYSATIRPPEMLPGQVRLLRSLLAGREGRVGWVILADGQAGTFTAPGVRPPPPPGASRP